MFEYAKEFALYFRNNLVIRNVSKRKFKNNPGYKKRVANLETPITENHVLMGLIHNENILTLSSNIIMYFIRERTDINNIAIIWN